jgi:hypothetical protein
MEKDYIMRQIQLMVAVLLRIMHLVAGKDFFTAKAEIKDAVKLTTGFSPEQLKRLSIDELLMIFEMYKEDANAHAAYTGKFLLEEAKILEEEKQIDESLKGYNKALEIYEYLNNNNLIPGKLDFDIKEEIKFLQKKFTHHLNSGDQERKTI